MSVDTPAGDRPDEPEVWDVERVRDSELRFAAQGRTCLVAAARHRPSGDLLVRLAATSPATIELLTWNSSTNAPMLAVSAMLGFRTRAEEVRVRLEL